MAIDHRRDRRLRLRAPGLPRRDHLALGEPDTVPDRIEVTSRFLERAGDPWFPVTGEIHFSRISRSRWPEVLGHARAGGLDSVATYVFWQAHEPTPGVFRWDGDLDLRAFIELAQDCGLDVIVRMGPWAHGEARHGGFPDWLMELGLDTRTNDPAYLALATRFYAEIVTQLRGLTHAEGGPVGGGSDDPGELRWSVRSDGHRGYLFLTTYQPPKRPIAAQPGVSVTLDFEDATIIVPSAPVDLPEGVSVAWPLRYPLTDGLVLRSATAGLLSRVSDELGDVVVLSATPGVDVELVLEGEVEVGGPVAAQFVGGATVVRLTGTPGPACVVELPGVRVVVLDDGHADQLYRLRFGGADRLVLSDAPVYVMGDDLIAHTEARQVTLGFLPAPDGLTADGALLQPAPAMGPWAVVTLSVPAAGSQRLLGGLAPVAPAPPAPRTGGPLGRLSAPTDFSGAASVRVDVPAEVFDATDRVIVRVTWTGDVGRAVLGSDVISDHFWHGRVWDIDVTPHRDLLRTRPLELQLLPWREDTGVWVDPSVREVADGISITGIDAVRVARVTLTAPEDPRALR